MKRKNIKIVADENISGLDAFEKFADVFKVSGRMFSVESIKDADALLVRSVSKIDKNLLEDSSVKFVASATSGIDHVDVNYLHEKNIQFAHAPGSNANSVVQYVFASLAFLSQKYLFDWRKLSVGIVGAGNIGALLADYLTKLNINFIIYDPLLTNNHRHSDKFSSFEKVIKQDVLSVHTPLTTEGPYPTNHLFDEAIIKALNKDCILINTSRGAVFDNQALFREYKNNSWRCVLDAWENEPDILIPLLAQVDIGTSHIAGYSYEGKEQGTAQIYQDFLEFFCLENVSAYRLKTENKLLTISNKETDLEQINAAILGAYKIQDDYQQMLKLANKTQASSFDSLRKNYSLRREFQYYRLDYSCFSESAGKVLRSLGFN